jgi:cyclopropane fatty-acyl-phospholipid synthase-like methyltransferase
MFWKKWSSMGKFEPAEVAAYYDKETGSYLKTYGEVIQAFRPSDTTQLLNYIMESASLAGGQRILDAGCGVGGPALFFAEKLNCNVEAFSISSEQIRIAKENQKERDLVGIVHFKVGDFHELNKLYTEKKFERIVFLESLGHAKNPIKVLRDACQLLERGGRIYIKDFFPFEIRDQETKKNQRYVINRINQAYYYNVLDLNTVVSELRKSKLEIQFIRKFEFDDDISARESFERLNKIDLFGNIPEFRVAEWLELCFQKPDFDNF